MRQLKDYNHSLNNQEIKTVEEEKEKDKEKRKYKTFDQRIKDIYKLRTQS